MGTVAVLKAFRRVLLEATFRSRPLLVAGVQVIIPTNTDTQSQRQRVIVLPFLVWNKCCCPTASRDY